MMAAPGGPLAAAAPAVAVSTKLATPLICGGHSRPVPHLAYSPVTVDGFFLVSACLDGKAMLRNGQTGDWIGTFMGHKGAVWSASLNSNACLAATGSADYTCKIWDALTGDCKHTFEHKKIVKTVDFSKDSGRVLTGGMEKLLRVWDLQKPIDAPQTLTGHTESIKVALFLNESTVLSAGGEPGVRVWDLRSGKEARVVPTRAPVSSIELTADGNTLTVAAGKEVTFFETKTFNPTKAYSFAADINWAGLHPSGTRFVVGGSADFWDHVMDMATGKELEVHKGHHGPVHCVRYAPDGETFASGSEDGTIRLIQNEVKPYGLWQLSKTPDSSSSVPETQS